MQKHEHHKQGRIDKLVAAHLDAMRARKYSVKTIKAYAGPLNRFVLYLAERGIERVQDVTSRDIEQYQLALLDHGFKEATQSGYLRAVRDFFKYLEKSQHIFTNPAAELTIGRGCRDLQPVPTEADVKRLLAQPDLSKPVGVRDRAILETLYSTALRLEELVSLNVYDPIMKQARLRVLGKGSKERVVPLGKQAVRWLKLYLKDVRPGWIKDPDESALWLGVRGGRRLHPIQIQHDIKQYSEEAKTSVPISAHALRRACATHMLRNGAHPVQIQMLLGHATLGTLSQYLRVTITDMMKMHKGSRLGR